MPDARGREAATVPARRLALRADSAPVAARISLACPHCESERFTVSGDPGEPRPFTCVACAATFPEPSGQSLPFAIVFTVAEPAADSDAYAAAFPHAAGPAR